MSQIPSVLVVLCLVITILWSHNLQAQVRTSNNYQIQSDSINVAGGFSSSSNYVQQATVGEIATGPLDSATYNLYGGFQQMQEVFLSIGGVPDVTMNVILPGVGGGTSQGSTTATATTDNPAGYQLSISASESPAMRSGANTLADYVPSGAAPDLEFTTDASDAHFAFSPFGSDVVQRFLTNDIQCDIAGAASSTACWDGLSTSQAPIAQSNVANHPSGTDTTVYFRVGLGSATVQPSGIYIATSTLTLIAL